MMDFIERMRKKPSSVKTRFAFLVALICTLVIGTMWSISTVAQFKSKPITSSAVEDEKSNKEAVSDLAETVNGNEAPDTQDEDDHNKETQGDQSPQGSVESITELIRRGSTTTSGGDEAVKKSEPKVILIATTTSKKTE